MNKLATLEELGKGLDYLVKQSAEFNQHLSALPKLKITVETETSLIALPVIKRAIFQLQTGIVAEDNWN